MWFDSLLASCRSGRSRSRRPKPSTASPRSFRPGVEVLEDRCTPSSLSGRVEFGSPNPHGFGAGNVKVTLLEETTSGVWGWTPVQVTKTAGSGSGAYSFTGLQPGLYAIEVAGNLQVSVGTVNGQKDGDGPIPLFLGGLPETAIANISLGANQAGINYDFYLPGFSGG
jgi:hypothetical protein